MNSIATRAKANSCKDGLVHVAEDAPAASVRLDSLSVDNSAFREPEVTASGGMVLQVYRELAELCEDFRRTLGELTASLAERDATIQRLEEENASMRQVQQLLSCELHGGEAASSACPRSTKDKAVPAITEKEAEDHLLALQFQASRGPPRPPSASHAFPAQSWPTSPDAPDVAKAQTVGPILEREEEVRRQQEEEEAREREAAAVREREEEVRRRKEEEEAREREESPNVRTEIEKLKADKCECEQVQEHERALLRNTGALLLQLEARQQALQARCPWLAGTLSI